MKTLFAFLALMTVIPQAHAAVLICDDVDHFQTGLVDKLQGECRAHSLDINEDDGWRTEEQRYRVDLRGYGVGLSAAVEKVVLTCPRIGIDGLTRLPMVGVNATAKAAFGAGAGVFVNGQGKSCYLTGAAFGFGAGFSGARLKVKAIK